MDGAGTTEVLIASLALVGTSIGGLLWAMKYFARTLGKDLVAHTKAAQAQTRTNKEVAKMMDTNTKAMDANTKANEEVLLFMRNLNGRLAKATVETIKESKELIKEAKR